MDRPIISIQNVKKEYRLGAIGGGTLKGDLQSWMARKRHKEDPNQIIGQTVQEGDRFLALDDISLEISAGERVGIIGHNGAGKSTLLKLLCRVTAPSDGRISYNGRITSMLEVGTGFHPELTGRENVYMNGAILGMKKSEISKKMEDIIDFSEVRQFIDTPVKRYSSGMYVKLAFSVAAHLDSEIMIMDEVLAVGDISFQQKCLDKMRRVSEDEGRTILYVSHNMNTIRQLCERCIVLDRGKKIFDGNVEDAIQIYLGINTASDSDIMLTDVVREEYFRDHPVTMDRFTVLNSDDGVFQLGGEIRFRLTCHSREDFENVFIRVILKASDGNPVTMSYTEEALTIHSVSAEVMEGSFSISGLVPGKYTLTPVIYQANEYGGDRTLDVVRDIYRFEIAGNNEFNHNMVWQPKYWGYMYGNSIHIEK